MRTKAQRFLITMTAVVIAVNVLLLIGVLTTTEPAYGGRHLSKWLEDLERSTTAPDADSKKYSAATNALQKIGTNAIPHLLAMLQAKDGHIASRLRRWLGGDPTLNLGRKAPHKLKREAVLGFQALGAKAHPAVPELLRVVQAGDTVTRVSAMEALAAMAEFAPQIVPGIIPVINGPDRYAQSHAILALMQLQPQSAEAVKPLAEVLTNGLADARGAAAMALREMGPLASNALPSLLVALQDTEAQTRAYAVSALESIGVASASVRSELQAAMLDGDTNVAARARQAMDRLFGTPKTP